jgi:hypothetical protein
MRIPKGQSKMDNPEKLATSYNGSYDLSFPVLTIVDYLVGHPCNSRACFTSKKYNVPDGISLIVSHRSTK